MAPCEYEHAVKGNFDPPPASEDFLAYSKLIVYNDVVEFRSLIFEVK